MRLVSWNIQAGGGQRLEAICTALAGWAPDVVALQEVRKKGAGEIAEALGFGHMYLGPGAGAAANRVMVAAKVPVEGGAFMPEAAGPCHIVEAEVAGLTLIAAHFPQKAAQVPLFDALDADSASLLGLDTLLVGDLNCGIPFVDSTHKTFANARRFAAMLEAGWVDLFRQAHGEAARAYSWVSPRTGRGFRYDHALASPSLAKRVRAVRYDHGVREEGASDHSALIVEID